MGILGQSFIDRMNDKPPIQTIRGGEREAEALKLDARRVIDAHAKGARRHIKGLKHLAKKFPDEFAEIAPDLQGVVV